MRRRYVAQIIGNGIGGASAAVALSRLGWHVHLSKSPRKEPRPIVVSNVSQYLIERVWGPGFLTDLQWHPLNKRVIYWRQGRPEVVEDRAIVIDGAVMADRMASRVGSDEVAQASTLDGRRADWTIVAHGRVSDRTGISGGRRVATVAPVALARSADPTALIIEATEHGWLALVPTALESGVVFAVSLRSPEGGPTDLNELISATKTIDEATAEVVGPARVLEAAPALRHQPSTEGIDVFVGEAAIALDPLSGDGTASSLRTANLAASMAHAFLQGASLQALQRFYECRLARAMHRHLQGLLALYEQAAFVSGWSSEISAMNRMSDAVLCKASDSGGRAFGISQGRVVALAR